MASNSPAEASSGGQWLFKQGDLLLGPVAQNRLIGLIESGEVDAETPVSLHGGDGVFRKLGQVDVFRVHLAKAEARQRVEKQSQELDARDRKSRIAKIAGIVVAAVVVLGGGGQLAWWLAIHRPWEKQLQLPEPEITDELPVIALASARKDDDEIDYPDATKPGAKPPQQLAHNSAPTPNPKTPPAAVTAKPPPREGKKPVGAAPAQKLVDNDVNSVQQWDQSAINAVVKANKKSLHTCLSAEAQRQKAGWSARIPLEFTIGNDGRVTKLWIDNPDYKADSTELHKCMLSELRKWQFPHYEGEQANVQLAFTVGAH